MGMKRKHNDTNKMWFGCPRCNAKVENIRYKHKKTIWHCGQCGWHEERTVGKSNRKLARKTARAKVNKKAPT